MVERYIGIENELKSFLVNDPDNVVSFSLRDFEYIRNVGRDYIKSPTCIRTDKGLGYYIDGAEIEIMTPPIAINKGFATRLTDTLMIGRDHIINSTPHLNHTGYSMHWNLSSSRNVWPADFYLGVAVPIQMFGLTPLSGSFNVRTKADNHLSRYEILADSTINEEQINATSLLLGSYLNTIEFTEGNLPFLPTNLRGTYNQKTAMFIPNGRYDTIEVYFPESYNVLNFSVQQYMEEFFKWITPAALKLSTDEEYENLRAFIYGEKLLEMDRFKYFSYLYDERGIKSGTYFPIKTDDEIISGQVLKSSGKNRDLPLESILLGEIVNLKNEEKLQIDTLDWDSFRGDFQDSQSGQSETITAQNVTEIYEIANRLNPKLPKFTRPYNPYLNLENKLFAPKFNFSQIEVKPVLSYNSEKEVFKDNRKTEIRNENYYFWKELKKKPFTFLSELGVYAVISFCIAGLAMAAVTSYHTSNLADEAISKINLEQIIKK